MKKAFSFALGIILGFALIFGVRVALDTDSPVYRENRDKAEEVEALLVGKTCYYYNGLNEEQQTAYRLLYRTLMGFGERVRVKISEDDMKSIWTAVIYDNPEIFWTGYDYEYLVDGDRIEIIPKYSMTAEDAEKITAELNVKIDEIVSATENMQSDYEKELYIHDYVCLNTVYDESTFKNIGNTAYSSLLKGTSICEGYSRAVQTLLDRVGIKNYLIVGNGTSDGKTEPHMWNIVELDGKKYHLDATWDDFDADEGVGHLYFNVTDADILYDHSELDPANNECSCTDENYFYKNGTYIERFDSYNTLVEPSANIIKNGVYCVEFKFASKNDCNRAVDILENDDEKFFAFVDKVTDKTGGKIKNDEVSYMNPEDSNYLRISFIKE